MSEHAHGQRSLLPDSSCKSHKIHDRELPGLLFFWNTWSLMHAAAHGLEWMQRPSEVRGP